MLITDTNDLRSTDSVLFLSYDMTSYGMVCSLTESWSVLTAG